MVLLALARGRTAFCMLLPEAPSIQTCVSGSLSSCPLPGSGVGSNAVRWYTHSSGTPVAANPARAALFCRCEQILSGEVVGTGTPCPRWGPQACVTSKGWRRSQLRAAGAGKQAQDPPPVSWAVLKVSPHSSFWSLPTLEESQKQWRRDESFCIPKAIL